MRDLNFVNGDISIVTGKIDTDLDYDFSGTLANRLRVTIIKTILADDCTFFDTYKGVRIIDAESLELELESNIKNYILTKYPTDEDVALLNCTCLIVLNTLNIYFWFYNDLGKKQLISNFEVTV